MRKEMMMRGAVAALLALAAGVAAATEATLGLPRTVVQWTFPREGTCHEGIPFADGSTGVLVWGGGDSVKLTVGRADLWDHRGGYPWTAEQNYTNIAALAIANDQAGLRRLFYVPVPENWNPDGNPFTDRFNPYLLPLGRVTVRLPGATLASGSLDTATGLGKLTLADGREVELAMSMARRVFAFKAPRGLSPEVRVIPSTDFPIYANKLKGRGFAPAEKRTNGFTWRLPADPAVSLDCERIENDDGTTLLVRTARGESSPVAANFAAVRDDSRAYWERFWREGARVRVPDPLLQEQFDYGMYRFGAMTDPKGTVPGLQGAWLEDDQLVPWNGDYHFNINVQEYYSPAYRGGHFRNLMPLFKMVLAWRPRLRENARQFIGIDDGYMLPHSVDDRGVCIGGFWTGTIDHGSTAWVAAMMYRYVRYARDLEFLRSDAYDFMRGAMNVYLAMFEERDGRLSLPLGPSPEWGGDQAINAVGRDPSFQLAAAHRLASDLIAAAKQLGESVDPRWLEVERRLPDYTRGPGGVLLFEGQTLDRSHRHHSHLAGFYPFDTIDLAAHREDAIAAYRQWVWRGTGEWTGWSYPWASILHTHFGSPNAAVFALHTWSAFHQNEGHGSLHDGYWPGKTEYDQRHTIMQMDAQSAAATAVMELLVHEINGKVEYFRGCPSGWREVEFENLALSDGTRVSGRRSNGKVTIRK